MRWTNVGADGCEFISSHNSVVGWFVGYGPAVSSGSSTLTGPRSQQCERGMLWDMAPPFCRPDNIDLKNEEVRSRLAGDGTDELLDEWTTVRGRLAGDGMDEFVADDSSGDGSVDYGS